jgi:hypothetical protein
MIEPLRSDLHTLSNGGSHNGSRREDNSTGELPKRGKLTMIEPLCSDLHTLTNCGSHNGSRRDDLMTRQVNFQNVGS